MKPETDLIERNVLSCAMKGAPEAYRIVSAGIKPEHFQNHKHKVLFSAITASAANVKETDPSAVWSELANTDGRSPLTISELVEIESVLPASTGLNGHVEALLATFKTSTLVSVLANAQEALKTPAMNWSERWDSVAPYLEQALAVSAASKTRPLVEIVESAKRDILQPEKRLLVPTGFDRWDKNAGMLKGGELITVAARPGCGKTAIAIQICDHAASQNIGAAFFSLEMSGEELVNRMALRRAGKGAFFNPKTSLPPVLDDIAKLKTFYVFDNCERQSVGTIAARSRLLAASPRGLGVIVVDYLQLVTPTDSRAIREQQVADMSRRFKELAGELKVPVIILAQLNRESEKEDRQPRLSDLRESGAIEQDSDRVWFLWEDSRNKVQVSPPPDDITVTLIQAKCRGGKPWLSTDLRFERPIFRFAQI